MAVRAAIRYIAHHILREIGVGTFVPANTSVGATELRVFDMSIFDPGGGQCVVEASDNLFTYTHIEDDVLKGIPSSGDGSITNTIVGVTNTTSRSLIYRAEFVVAHELEQAIDRYRERIVQEAFPDADYKIYTCARGWFDTGLAIRDDSDDTYTTLTPASYDYERGTVEFSTAQTEEVLYFAGWCYNPFATIADLLEVYARDGRLSSYHAHGSSVESKRDIFDIAAIYRRKAAHLNLITG